MKNITVSDEVVEMIDKLGISYDEGNIQYKDNVWHIVPFVIGLFFGLFTMGGVSMVIERHCDRVEEYEQSIILTGEYGQPDGRTTLTGPYVEQGK